MINQFREILFHSLYRYRFKDVGAKQITEGSTTYQGRFKDLVGPFLPFLVATLDKEGVNQLLAHNVLSGSRAGYGHPRFSQHWAVPFSRNWVSTRAVRTWELQRAALGNGFPHRAGLSGSTFLLSNKWLQTSSSTSWQETIVVMRQRVQISSSSQARLPLGWGLRWHRFGHLPPQLRLHFTLTLGPLLCIKAVVNQIYTEHQL